MTQAESEAVAEIVIAAGGRKGAVLVWSTADDSRFSPFLAEAHRFSVEQNDNESAAATRYAVYRGTADDLSLAIRTVWNSYDHVDIVPADSGESDFLAEVVEGCSHGADEARLGIDWQNRWLFQQESGCLALLGFAWETIGFIMKLLFSNRFRRELADPFRRVVGMTVATKHGASIEKEGHDESVGLGFLTSNRDIVDDVMRILDIHGIPLIASERSREAHWKSEGAA